MQTISANCPHGLLDHLKCMKCKQIALKKAEDEYYNKESSHYKDNERFKWATEVIEKRYENAGNIPSN